MKSQIPQAPQSQSIQRSISETGPQLIGKTPCYQTKYGAAYAGDSLELLRLLPDASINVVVTSPPYALHFKKSYGNVSKDDYVAWFKPFAAEILRVLTEDGSFVLNIGGSWNPGSPTRSLYHYKLLIALVEEVGFHLAQECYWYNPAKMPVPAEWVTVRRVRIKDSVEHVWWLSKSKHPKASNLHVLNPYSADMLRLNNRGVKETVRPSGHVINKSWEKLEGKGSIPGNVIEEKIPSQLPDDLLKFGNNSANDPYTLRCKEAGVPIHPARFPEKLPEFFIRMLTNPDDLVLDVFAGSNTTGAVAEREGRRWLSFESDLNYVAASAFRFMSSEATSTNLQDAHSRILRREEVNVPAQESQLSMFEEPTP